MSDTIRCTPFAEPGATVVTFLPKMIEHPEPGGVNWMTLSRPRCVVDVEPPTQVAVELLGAIASDTGRTTISSFISARPLPQASRSADSEDVDVLFDGAAAYADACDPLASKVSGAPPPIEQYRPPDTPIRA